MEVVTELQESGDYVDSILSLKNARLTTVKLSADNGPTLIELLEFQSPRSQGPVRREAHAIGPSHIACAVDDLDKTYLQLSRAGVQFNASPQLSPDGYAKVTFCRDPDGTLVELVEVLDATLRPPASRND